MCRRAAERSGIAGIKQMGYLPGMTDQQVALRGDEFMISRKGMDAAAGIVAGGVAYSHGRISSSFTVRPGSAVMWAV